MGAGKKWYEIGMKSATGDARAPSCVVQRGTAVLTTPTTAPRAQENFDISALPQDAIDEINGIQTRQKLNPVVRTGVPGFIPKRVGA